MTNSSKNKRIMIRVVVAICFIGIAWGFYYSQNKPVDNSVAVQSNPDVAMDHNMTASMPEHDMSAMNHDNMAASGESIMPLAVSCDQDRKCALPNGDTVQFVNLKSINEPFDLVYSGKAFSAKDKITVGFSMKSMNMGVTRYSFVANDKDAKGQIIKAIKLPVCAMGHKDYYATFTVEGQSFEVAMEDWFAKK